MFRCDIGGEVVGPGVAMRKIVTARRSREYMRTSGQQVSQGWEIVREISACDEHALKHQQAHAADVK